VSFKPSQRLGENHEGLPVCSSSLWACVPGSAGGCETPKPEVSIAQSCGGPACRPELRSAAISSPAARNCRASSGRPVPTIASHTSSTSRA